MTPITSFKGEHQFLSNFYPCRIQFEGLEYPSVEHAYQAAKTLDPEEREKIRDLSTPGKAKRAGKKLKLRPDWEEVRLEVMEHLLREKFLKFYPLTEKLAMTGDAELVEGNTWGDTFWGVCRGEGENHLGKLLMKIRAKILAPIYEIPILIQNEPPDFQEPDLSAPIIRFCSEECRSQWQEKNNPSTPDYYSWLWELESSPRVQCENCGEEKEIEAS